MANENCEKCGAALNGAQFCPSCGTAVAVQAQTQPKPQPAPPPPSQISQTVYTAPNTTDVPPPKGGRYSVMSIGSFMGSMLLFSVPVVGFIFMVIWAFGGCENQNRRNFARASLIWLIIGVVLTIVGAVLMAAGGISLLERLQDMAGSYTF